MATCALCGTTVAKLAKSHVYPKSLHALFADAEDDVPPLAIRRNPNHTGQAVQKSLGGVYGRFVCASCEDKCFGPADNEFMRLHHQLSSEPLPDSKIELAPQLVDGSPELLHRFALQTFWRWIACPDSGVGETNGVGFGPVIERVRGWLQIPGGTLWTGLDVVVSYRIAADDGFALPPIGSWRAGAINMTVGNFSFFMTSRVKGLPPSLQPYCLHAENGVRLLATTEMHNWIIDPMADMLGNGRMEETSAFIERLRAYSRNKRGSKP